MEVFSAVLNQYVIYVLCIMFWGFWLCIHCRDG